MQASAAPRSPSNSLRRISDVKHCLDAIDAVGSLACSGRPFQSRWVELRPCRLKRGEHPRTSGGDSTQIRPCRGIGDGTQAK
jgi:hypothetical protein